MSSLLSVEIQKNSRPFKRPTKANINNLYNRHPNIKENQSDAFPKYAKKPPDN